MPVLASGIADVLKNELKWSTQNKLVYHCFFDTPLRHKHWYTPAYTTKARQSFLDIQQSEGWGKAVHEVVTAEEGTEEDGAVNVVNVRAPNMVVGTFVTRWFTTPELPANFAEGLRGAYVDGIIMELNTTKKKSHARFLLTYLFRRS